MALLQLQSPSERGISMSAPMMSAYLAGIKGETRRIVSKTWLPNVLDALKRRGPEAFSKPFCDVPYQVWEATPYGCPGEELYFREHWRTAFIHDARKPSEMQEGTTIRYEADLVLQNPMESIHSNEFGRFRQGRFMCRWMSRVRHVPILDIRAERLQDITEEGAINEGVIHFENKWEKGWQAMKDMHTHATAREAYEGLWEIINGPLGPNSWDANPYVWVIKFPKRELP